MEKCINCHRKQIKIGFFCSEKCRGEFGDYIFIDKIQKENSKGGIIKWLENTKIKKK
jgi:hypothetical protein